MSRAARRRRNAGKVKEGSPVRWTGMNLIVGWLEPLERPHAAAVDFNGRRGRCLRHRGRTTARSARRRRADTAHERADACPIGPDARGIEGVPKRELNAALL